MRHRKKEEGPGDSGSSAEGVPLGRGSPPTSESSTKAPTSSQWTLCSCQTVAVVFGAIALVSFFFGRHLFPMIAEDVAVLKGTEKTEPPPVHEDVMEIFRLFDLLPDGKIDPVEFDHIAQYLPRRREFLSGFKFRPLDRPLTTYDKFEFVDEYISEEKEVLRVKTEFEPIDKSSIKTIAEGKGLIFGRNKARLMPGLYQWNTVAVEEASYGAGNFRVFAPPTDTWEVGVPYRVIQNDSCPHMDFGNNRLNPYRFHPPLPEGKAEELIHALLSQFHPNVFVHMRINPRGTMAVVRAHSDSYLDIVFRCHAEFQLHEPPEMPFWFTPAQFAGRLVISKDFSHIAVFEMELPTIKTLNIDMEWIRTADGMENQVDIGYVPKMRLFAVAPSKAAGAAGGAETKPEPTWKEEISVQEAESILERTFYPFKEIPYLPFTDAFDKALEENKPVHHILLWGALDDQSC